MLTKLNHIWSSFWTHERPARRAASRILHSTTTNHVVEKQCFKENLKKLDKEIDCFQEVSSSSTTKIYLPFVALRSFPNHINGLLWPHAFFFTFSGFDFCGVPEVVKACFPWWSRKDLWELLNKPCSNSDLIYTVGPLRDIQLWTG